MRDLAPKRITIFEGPDGGGKSTIAQAYAEMHGARYVHHGPYPRVAQGLARVYFESMLPALLGYQDVVLDRAWLSEPIYGAVFRDGRNRVSPSKRRVLDRVALRCGAVVVSCLPPVETCLANYRSRKAIEMLDNEDQLRAVHAIYSNDDDNVANLTQLNTVVYDYTSITPIELLNDIAMMQDRTPPHTGDFHTVGNFRSKILLVGADYGPHKDGDPLLQLPFASLCNSGCSLWLAHELEKGGVSEQSLAWINADQFGEAVMLDVENGYHVVALGGDASRALKNLGVLHHVVAHPQAHKRFKHGQQYPLIPLLKELIYETRRS